MLQPANIPISADRWVICRRTFAFVGYNFTGATFRSQIRLTPDATGSALVALATQTTDIQGIRLTYAGSDTIANHKSAGRLAAADVTALLATTNPATGNPYQTSDTILLSTLAIRIDEATMAALPAADQTGDDVTLAWDLHITPSGGDEDKYAGGDFTVRAGVTQ